MAAQVVSPAPQPKRVYSTPQRVYPQPVRVVRPAPVLVRAPAKAPTPVPPRSPAPADPPEPPGDKENSIAYIEEKIRKGRKLTEDEKKAIKEHREEAISIDELEGAHNKILRQLTKNVGSLKTKELPKALEIVSAALAERKAKGGGRETQSKKIPTRKEMIAALQGRAVKAV